MGKSCWIVPTVKTADGTIVKSKLWNDLYELTGKNREQTLRFYKVANDPSFIDAVSDMADFDKNGQITARSFLSLSGYSAELDDILDKIRSKYQAKQITGPQAVDRIIRFNTEESYKEDYVPEISTNADGSVNLDIVERNPETVAALMEKLEQNELCQRIIKRLKDLGIAFDFVGTNKYNGRFSTENAQEMIDGVYHLIELSTGGDVNSALIEEAAHFATVSLKDSDLIVRLKNALKNKDVVESLFTEEEIAEASLSTDPELELAGKLVKKSMENKVIPHFQSFLSRIRQFIYSVFSKLHLTDIISDKNKARLYATQIADGFLYRDDNSREKALENDPITLYANTSISKVKEQLRSTLRGIESLRREIQNVSGELASSLFKDTSINAILDGKDFGALGDDESIGIIGTAISNLTSNLNYLFDKVLDIDFDKDPNYEELRIYDAVIETKNLLKSLLKAYESIKDISEEQKTDFSKLAKSIGDTFAKLDEKVDSSFDDYILQAGQKITAQIIRFILGKDAYEESARIVSNGFFKGTKVLAPVSYSAEELASRYVLEQDINGLATTLSNTVRHLNNSLDLGSQIFYQVVRRVKTNAARRYKELSEELEKIKEKAKQYGIDVTEFYERYPDRSFTGYFVSNDKLSLYHQDRKQLEDKIKKDYLKELNETGQIKEFRKWTKSERIANFNGYKTTREEWIEFERNAFEDPISNRKLKGKYTNSEEFQKIMSNTKKKEIYDDIMAWLSKVNNELMSESINGSAPKAYFTKNLIPQFRGSMIERWNNRKGINKDLFDQMHTETLCLDVSSNDFGSPLDELHPEFEDKYSLFIGAEHSIPLYGVKKLEDMRDLSTDLFASLNFYAGMACRFGSTKLMYPTLKIMNETLSKRSNNFDTIDQYTNELKESNLTVQSRKDRTRAMEILLPKKPSWMRRALNKIGGVVAFAVLFGDVRAGVKNWIGALNVVINDALAGTQDFKLRDVLRATTRNLFLPQHMLATPLKVIMMRDISFDDYQKLVSRWDAARDPRIQRKSKESFIKTAAKWLGNIAMSNYGVTDESIIAIIYDSYMSAKYVYDAEAGEKISLGKKGYVWKDGQPELKTTLLKDSKDAELYKVINNVISEIDNTIKENADLGDNDYKKDITDILNSQNGQRLVELLELGSFKDEHGNRITSINNDGSVKKLSEYKALLSHVLESIQFTEEDEVKVCEGINDYITTSQGLYGLVNANELMTDAWTAGFTKIKGWQFGFIQRNLLSNSSITKGDYKPSVLSTALLALKAAMLWTPRMEHQIELTTKEFLKYKWRIFAVAAFPFALQTNLYGLFNIGNKDKTSRDLRKYLADNGWSPEQLNTLSFFIIGLLMWLLQNIIVEKTLSRGNLKKYGDYLKGLAGDKAAGKQSKTVEKQEPGWLFKSAGLLFDNEEAFLEKYNKFLNSDPPYPYKINQKKLDNVEFFYTLDDLPDLKDKESLPDWVNSNTVVYVEEEQAYYKPDKLDKASPRWVKADYGYFDEPDTEEYNQHVLGMQYSEYTYDTSNVWYYILGLGYRTMRGVISERESLMSPAQWGRDLIDLADPLAVSAGLTKICRMAGYAIHGQSEKAWQEPANFVLNKYGLEIDGDGLQVGNTPYKDIPITLLDQYHKQDMVEFYRKFH